VPNWFDCDGNPLTGCECLKAAAAPCARRRRRSILSDHRRRSSW
jgi:hypothetical protein